MAGPCNRPRGISKSAATYSPRWSSTIRGAESAFRGMPGHPDKYLADLYHLAQLVLTDGGVTCIAGGEHCTFSEPKRFYSYRRDRETGRMATMIWIK